MRVGDLVDTLKDFNQDAEVEGQMQIGSFLIDLTSIPVGKKRGPKPGCKRGPYTGAKRGPKPKNAKKSVKKDIKKNVKKADAPKKTASKEASTTGKTE